MFYVISLFSLAHDGTSLDFVILLYKPKTLLFKVVHIRELFLEELLMSLSHMIPIIPIGDIPQSK